jgi:hypothetical protein
MSAAQLNSHEVNNDAVVFPLSTKPAADQKLGESG